MSDSTASFYILGFAMGVFFALRVYFIPYFVALKRGHRNRSSIGTFNFFLGRSFFGWVAALVWVYSDNVEERAQ